ncbi:MAG: ABC transporter ATP-binding protein [Rhodospirillaceae bacterium]
MSILIENLGFRYPGGAGLEGINLSVAAGEFCAVIGPSGCGKTTLLQLIAGFLFPGEGAIHLSGVEVSGVPPRLRDLGVVFQNYALFPHMTAVENVAYPLKLRGMARAERLARAGEALERAHLSGFADRLPTQLSGGQQQRVALARALVFRPRALLLDEPLSALDAAHRAAMRDEIRQVQREHGIATLHVTHDQEEALSIADRVAVMEGGRLLQAAPPRELYDRPVNRFVAGFVGHANLFDGTVSGGGIDTAIGHLRCADAMPPAGSRVTVLIRPEALEILTAPDAAAEDGAALYGEVTRDRFLGSLRRFDLTVAGGTVLGETSSREPILGVRVPPRAVHLLPPEA